MKRIFYISVLTAGIHLFTACGSNDKEQQVNTTTPVKVVVQKVASDGGNPYLSASGKIQAKNSANLSTNTMGFVNKILVKVGDKVQKGQLLVSINNANLQAKSAQVNASIAQATAGYNNAEKDYTRFKNLFAENSASQKELDDMTARFEMAKAQLEAAKQMKNEVNAQYSYVNIRAPFNGVVTNKFIEEGDMANPGMTLVAVETPGNFEVSAMVPELVKVSLDASDDTILSGMYAIVQFPIEKASKSDNKVLIASKALVTKGQLSGVYTVSQNNTALLRWLRLGRTFGENVEVLSGLSADESYITSSESKLYNGAKIAIQ